jgi:threonine/homoserine/homoserine lactone efflux protein
MTALSTAREVRSLVDPRQEATDALQATCCLTNTVGDACPTAPASVPLYGEQEAGGALTRTLDRSPAMFEDASRSFVPLWMMLAYCATPGAVNAESLRRGIRGGFESALLVQLGAVAGRVVWAALALAGTASVAGSDPIRFGLAVLGATVLLRTAWHAMALQPESRRELVRGRPPRHGDFLVGLTLSLTNPLALVFWSGLGLTGSGTPDAQTVPLIVPSLAAGALVWSLGAAAAIGYGQRAIGRGALRIAELLTGATVGLFGLRLLWESGYTFMSIVVR